MTPPAAVAPWLSVATPLWLSLLAACAVVPAGGPVAEPGTFTSGRLALRVEATEQRPAQAFSAAFELVGDGTRGELKLLSPIGTQLLSARWAPGLAALITPAGATSFGSLEELSRQALGETLPLAALPDWLAGRAWPQATYTTLAAPAVGFEQLGWSVDLNRYVDGWVEARRRTPPAVSLRVRLEPSPG